MPTIRKPTRAQLAAFIQNQQVILAFEQLFDAANSGGPSLLSATTADSTAIANTTAPTKFSQTFIVPAGTLIPGEPLRFTMQALFSTTGSPTAQLRVLLGSTAILDTAAGLGLEASVTNHGITSQGTITCRASGTSGSVVASLTGLIGLGGSRIEVISTAPVTIDTTVDQALSLEWTWSAASPSNTIKLQQLLVEAMN